MRVSPEFGDAPSLGPDTSPYYRKVRYPRVRGFDIFYWVGALISGSRRLLISGKRVTLKFATSRLFFGRALIYGSRLLPGTGICDSLEFGRRVAFIGKSVNIGFETAP